MVMCDKKQRARTRTRKRDEEQQVSSLFFSHWFDFNPKKFQIKSNTYMRTELNTTEEKISHFVHIRHSHNLDNPQLQ